MVRIPMRQGLLQRLLDVCFPPRCVGCGQRGEWVCTRCTDQFEPLPDHRCERCSDPILLARRGRLCANCAHQPPAFDRLHSGYLFAGPLRTAIHHLKFRRARHLALPLGDALCQVVDLDPADFDIIVPVPLHPRRHAARGYNQAELIARPVATHLRRPLAPRALARIVDTPPQTERSVAERRVNVAGAFQASPDVVRLQRVLLVDDVCTTGATLDAAAQAVRNAGATRVTGLTLARASTTR